MEPCAALGLVHVACLVCVPLLGRTDLDSKPARTLRSPAAFDGGGFNLVANGQKLLAESFAPMPTQTKYTDVKGYATYYYYNGATTLPEGVPDLSGGRRVLVVHGAGSN